MLVAAILVIGLASLSYWLTKLWFRDSQKASPYECGFDPFGSARSPFSVRFYMVAILFLVFEVESLLFYAVLQAYKLGDESFNIYGWGFLIILILGLLVEMFKGALAWSRD
uniref:NADH-ubiquinone oxidoreductase chain 3 n=1 Tax=Mimachlamys senatoria TaxID=388643 RepID=T1SBK6_9BIVA|nr:NADH dehydrogenase subunit 3 [Mimachlamys senatoria]